MAESINAMAWAGPKLVPILLLHIQRVGRGARRCPNRSQQSLIPVVRYHSQAILRPILSRGLMHVIVLKPHTLVF